MARCRPAAAEVPGPAFVREGRLKDYRKTAGSQRAVPLRGRVVTALSEMPGKRPSVRFPAPEGGRIDINNWRNRSWTPSLRMIDRTYCHLVAGADADERELLDAYDSRR